VGDRIQAGALGGRVPVFRDIGRVLDLGQTDRGRIIDELELFDEHVEGALPVPVGVHGAFGVVRVPTLALGEREHLIARDEQELGLRVDESADQPGAGDPVDVGVLSGDPLHGCSSFREAATARRPSGFR
jgi:hypothetical protein